MSDFGLLGELPEEEEEEEPEEGEGAEVPGSFNPRDHFVVSPDCSPVFQYFVLNLTVPVPDSPDLSVPTIPITEIEHQLLVAILSSYRHRVVKNRLLPVGTLTKAIQAIVSASSEIVREEEAPEGIYLKVWIGHLNPGMETSLGTRSNLILSCLVQFDLTISITVSIE